MKKLLRALLLFLLLAIMTFSVGAESPYTTWTWGPGGSLFMTQDAYVPLDEIYLPIAGAEDMFVAPDGVIYIADTGNARILKLRNFVVIGTYGQGILQGPTGVFVDRQGRMYVADAAQDAIVIMDQGGNLLTQFGRPSEPLFGINEEFLPRKLAVDVRQNLYIISEGSVNGVVMMNTSGNFIGYFGANPASMSLKMILQRMFLTKAQLSKLVKNEAASPSNLYIDEQSMVYTVTAGTNRYEAVRKFTVAGRDILAETLGSTSFRDIDVSPDGLMVAVDANGHIYEYDTNGVFLFTFGAQDKGEQRIGTLSNPTAIARHGEQLYVLDKDKNAIVVYETTAFARKVHQGIGLYMDGLYAEAKPYFEQVLDFNGSYLMSYLAIGDAYFKAGDYPNALDAYRYAEYQKGYSQAFWELRNLVLQKYLGSALVFIAIAWIGISIFNRLEKRQRWLDPLRAWFGRLGRFKLMDDMAFLFRFIKQPVDSFYYIKKNQRGSLGFAMLIYAWVVIVRVLTLYLTGFSFTPYPSPLWIRLENEVVYVLLGIVIWNAANYLVSTISDGEGRVRDVVIGSAYSLFPYALFALPIALFSNVLTLNEVFLYSFSMNIVWFWTGMMLFIMVKEVHNYSFGETVRNVLVTIFTMALFLLTGYILYVLFSQLFDFISAIVQEVGLRG